MLDARTVIGFVFGCLAGMFMLAAVAAAVWSVLKGRAVERERNKRSLNGVFDNAHEV